MKMINRSKIPAPAENISFEIPRINFVNSSDGHEIYFIKKEIYLN